MYEQAAADLLVNLPDPAASRAAIGQRYRREGRPPFLWLGLFSAVARAESVTSRVKVYTRSTGAELPYHSVVD